MTAITCADYRWLVGSEGRRWLDRIADDDGSLVQWTARLRRRLRPVQVHLLLEQRELRVRAKAKFASAARMFFTRRSLEQATDQWIARYKASRFARCEPVADLCCGVGGDLIELARHGATVGVDADPIMSLLAQANATALGLRGITIMTRDATTVALEEFAAWHADPDRRATPARTSQPERARPTLGQLLDLQRASPRAAVKLAPAARLPDAVACAVERQWIGSRRECRQQVAWFGDLARHAGRRTALVVDTRGGWSELLVETDAPPPAPASRMHAYIHDPHAAVLAAGLGDSLAQQFALQPLARDVAYLTGDQPLHNPRMDTFAVHAHLPLDIRRLRAVLKHDDLAPMAIKKRGVPIDPSTLRKRLGRCGTRPATLLLAPWHGHTYVIITTRSHTDMFTIC